MHLRFLPPIPGTLTHIRQLYAERNRTAGDAPQGPQCRPGRTQYQNSHRGTRAGGRRRNARHWLALVVDLEEGGGAMRGPPPLLEIRRPLPGSVGGGKASPKLRAIFPRWPLFALCLHFYPPIARFAPKWTKPVRFAVSSMFLCSSVLFPAVLRLVWCGFGSLQLFAEVHE